MSAPETFRDLFENAPCGYLVTTVDGVITRANSTFASWLGITADDLVGKQFGELLEVGSRMFYETRYRMTLRLRGEVHEVAFVLAGANDQALPVLVNAVVVEHDLRSSIRMAIIDSSERLDYERDLLAARRLAEASEARVRVLQDASSAFGASLSDEALAVALVESARTAFDATAAAVLMVDSGGRFGALAGTHPIDLDWDAFSRPALDAINTGTVVAIGGLTDAAERYPELVDAMVASRFEAMTVAPLVGDGATLGVLLCFFGRAREYDEHIVSLHEALARLGSQVLARIRLQSQLEHAAQHDTLTGLANRALLRETLSSALSAAELAGRAIAMVFLDLDGFKAINDQLGHSLGDAVLREVAARLVASVRNGDIIGRFGGDEFMIVCENANAEDAAALAERVRLAIAEPIPGIPGRFVVSASIGVAAYQPSPGSLISNDRLFRLADDAMYESKARGGNSVSVVAATGERS